MEKPIMITVTDRVSGQKKHLTNGMITDIKENPDGSAKIELGKEGIVVDTTESFDWVLNAYNGIR